MLYQTSGSWTRDSTNMSIGEAQLDICAADANVMMASPAYAVTDKGGHLDANGYRWLGMQFGKVLHRAIDRRQNWRPLQPLSVTLSGTFLRADFWCGARRFSFDRATWVHLRRRMPQKDSESLTTPGTFR